MQLPVVSFGAARTNEAPVRLDRGRPTIWPRFWGRGTGCAKVGSGAASTQHRMAVAAGAITAPLYETALLANEWSGLRASVAAFDGV